LKGGLPPGTTTVVEGGGSAGVTTVAVAGTGVGRFFAFGDALTFG